LETGEKKIQCVQAIAKKGATQSDEDENVKPDEDDEMSEEGGERAKRVMRP